MFISGIISTQNFFPDTENITSDMCRLLHFFLLMDQSPLNKCTKLLIPQRLNYEMRSRKSSIGYMLTCHSIIYPAFRIIEINRRNIVFIFNWPVQHLVMDALVKLIGMIITWLRNKELNMVKN